MIPCSPLLEIVSQLHKLDRFSKGRLYVSEKKNSTTQDLRNECSTQESVSGSVRGVVCSLIKHMAMEWNIEAVATSVDVI